MSATQRFHKIANDALVRISNNLWGGAKLALVIYSPGEPGKDIVLKDQGLDLDEVLNTLRRSGLSIDGDNAYKRDLLDVAIGAMAFGFQNTNPPPPGHWGERFWEIGKAEADERDALRVRSSEEQAAYDLTVENWERLNQRCASLEEALDNIGGLSRALRQGGPDPMDLEGLSDALEQAVNIAHGALHAPNQEAADEQ